MKRLKENFHHYLPLLGILVSGFGAFFFFSFDRSFQLVITLLMAGGYVVWGAIHQYVHDELNIASILEYALVALLGVVVIYSLVLRA